MDGEMLPPLNAPTTLVRYDAARRALAEAVRFDDIKQIRNLAVAAQEYARQANDPELMDNATEIRKRAEIRGGEVLAEMEKNKGSRNQLQGDVPVGGSAPKPPTDPTPKLADLGITKTQSSRWQRLAALPKNEQESHIAAAKKSAVASLDHTTSQADKKQRRAEREQELAEKTVAASRKLGTRQYGVIYADPPWHFKPYSDVTGMDRAAENHYPTMTIEDIKALPIPAASDAVLFLWATVPMLPEALDVMAAWGFSYKSHCLWVKHKAGTGYWFRNRHELLLVGTRGNIPAPAPGEQYDSIIEARAGEHSAKPFHFTEIIEELFPTLPRLEMFHRGETYDGWDYWGNET
jgi:N6-adenosine-specific RNA methylase IME4